MLKRIPNLLGRVVGGLLVLVSLAVTASAQFKAGIEGTVTDTSGAVVAGVAITVTNQETGVSQKATTDAGGFYAVTNLPPGRYTVTASMAGFKTKVIADAEVSAEAAQGVNLTLEPGEVSTQVTVKGEALPAIQTEDATQSGTLTNLDVANLPQFRGDPFELLRLTPGVFGTGARASDGGSSNLPGYSGVGGSNRGIFQTENAVQVSANGSRLEANGYYLDGVTTNSQAWNGATVITPNAEAVKEIKVDVSPYDAENGHGAGAVVQVVSKNGTNSFHGSAALQIHSPGLNAFQRWGGPNGASANRDNLLTHDVLGSLGGPIWKDKAFFFYSFDHLKTGGATYHAQNWVETSQWISLLPSGSLAAKIFAVPGSGFTNAKILSSSTCANLGLTEGTNCATVIGGVDLGQNTGTPGTIVSSSTGGGFDGSPDVAFIDYQAFVDNTKATQHNGRVDYNVTQNDRVAFSFFYVPLSNSFLPGGWVDGRQYDIFKHDSKNETAALLWTRTLNPTTVNEARMNVTRWYFDEIKSNPQAPWGVPKVHIPIPNNTIAAGFFNPPGVFYQTTYTFRDTLSKVHNSHILKFGAEFAKEQNNSANTWGAVPSYDFNNLWSFANDAPTDEGTTTYNPKTGFPTDFRKYIRVSSLGLFAQDNWKARRNLTLTGGLRYDYFTPLQDKFGRLSNIILGSGNNALTGAMIEIGKNFSKPDRNNFGPQIGFAWSPGSFIGHEFNNKFVLRGGFGVAYNRVPESLLLNAAGNPPDFIATAFPTNEVVYGFSTCGTYCFTGFPANPAAILTFDPATGLPIGGEHLAKPDIKGPIQKLATPYTMHFSMEGQYDFGNNWMMSLSYQGSQGRKYPRSLNYALFYPQNPNINTVTIYQTDVNSHYNAMLARVSHRFSKGLELEAHYRLSKSSDACSSDQVCNQTFPFDQSTEYGPSDFDVTHSITAYAVWELPVVRNRHDWLHTAAGGWMLSPIFNFNSGFPWTPVVGTCISNVFGNVCPTRPTGYLGGAGTNFSTGTFQTKGGNFSGFSTTPATCVVGPPVSCQTKYFTVVESPSGSGILPPVPGVDRNVFRGPRYTGFDLSFGKRFTFPAVRLLGEEAGLEVRAEAYNLFNKTNASPFAFNSGSSNLGTFQTCSPVSTCPAGAAIPSGGTSGTFFAPNSTFGQATGALSGRVVEMYMKFSF